MEKQQKITDKPRFIIPNFRHWGDARLGAELLQASSHQGKDKCTLEGGRTSFLNVPPSLLSAHMDFKENSSSELDA